MLMSWLDSITASIDMNLSKLREIAKTGEPGMLQSIELQRVRCDWTATAYKKELETHTHTQGFPGGSAVKKLSTMQETQVPSLGRSPGGGNDNPLQYSCLENSMSRGA